MPTIAQNRICYPTHNVVCDPEVADTEYMEMMAHALNPAGDATLHNRELNYHNNDGTWTIERPTVTLSNFWSSERAEQAGRLPDSILATVTLHNGEYNKVITIVHCKRSESFLPIWKSLYQQRIKIGKKQRTAAETEYFKLYDAAVAEYNANNPADDPACAI